MKSGEFKSSQVKSSQTNSSHATPRNASSRQVTPRHAISRHVTSPCSAPFAPRFEPRLPAPVSSSFFVLFPSGFRPVSDRFLSGFLPLSVLIPPEFRPAFVRFPTGFRPVSDRFPSFCLRVSIRLRSLSVRFPTYFH